MQVELTQTFDFGNRRYYAGQSADVDPQVARTWIAEGKATIAGAIPQSPLEATGGTLLPWFAARLGIVGDSITQGISSAPLTGNFAGLMEPLVASNGGLNGALFTANVVAFHGAQRNCPAGNGTLIYTRKTNSITWQANSDTGPGAPVTLDRTKFVRLDSASAGMGVYVTLRPNGAGVLPATDTTDTSINVGALGNGYHPCCQFITECFADWLKPLLGPGYKVVGKWATSGNRIQNIIDQVPDIIAAGLDEVLLMIGTNDIAASGSTFSGVVSGLKSIIDGFTAAGVRVTLPGILPRGDAALTGQIRAANSWLQQYAAGKRLIRYIDTWPVLLNSTISYPSSSPYGVDTTMYNTTGGNYIHPSRKGSYALAKFIAAAMRDSRMPVRYEDPADLYSASNPYGNLITNPQMLVSSGRSGTVAGSNFNGNTTGTVPDDWTLYSPSTGVAASTTGVSRSSIDSTDTTPGTYWKINCTTAGVIEAFTPITIGNVSAGDIVEWWADGYVDNPSLFTRFDMGLDFNGADRLWWGFNSTGDSISTETTGRRFTLASPRFQVPSSWAWTGQAGTPNPVRFYVYMNVSASANAYLANIGLRKVMN
jgi:lysophospholipase L1-like esterase